MNQNQQTATQPLVVANTADHSPVDSTLSTTGEEKQLHEMAFGSVDLLQFNTQHATIGHAVILGPAALASLETVGIQATVGILTRKQDDGIWWAQVGDEEWCIGSGYDWRLRDIHLLKDKPACEGDEAKLPPYAQLIMTVQHSSMSPKDAEPSPLWYFDKHKGWDYLTEEGHRLYRQLETDFPELVAEHRQATRAKIRAAFDRQGGFVVAFIQGINHA